jgi:Domain of unknown function (DUF4333)
MTTLQGLTKRAPARYRALLAVLAAVAVLGGCSVTSIKPRDTLSATSVEAKIAAQLTRNYGVPSPRVDCPRSVPARVGSKFSCTTKLDGQGLALAGTVTGPHGRLVVQPTSTIIVVSAAEAQIGKSLARTFKAAVTDVSCDARALVVTSPGRTFACAAVIAGTHRKVVVTVTNLAGAVALRVLPYNPGQR